MARALARAHPYKASAIGAGAHFFGSAARLCELRVLVCDLFLREFLCFHLRLISASTFVFSSAINFCINFYVLCINLIFATTGTSCASISATHFNLRRAVLTLATFLCVLLHGAFLCATTGTSCAFSFTARFCVQRPVHLVR